MGDDPEVDGYANVYANREVGATVNPLISAPDALDEEFARGANRALQDAVELIRRLVPAHQSAAAIVVEEDWSSIRKYFSLSPKYAAWARYATPATGYGTHGWLLRSKQTVRLTQAELEAHPQWRSFGSEAERHPPMRGWLATPLLDAAGVCWGLLQLSDRESGDFTAADEAAVRRFADLLALTLESLWAVRNLRKAAVS